MSDTDTPWTMSRLLDQVEYWQPKDPIDGKTRILLTDMAASHRRHLLAWLRRRAEHLKIQCELRMLAGPGPSGDMACDAFDRECEELWEIPARVWIEQQPLVGRLARLVAEDRTRAVRALAGTVPAGALSRLRRRAGVSG